jgi:3D (Asp-Asp-Asp) domain-containing protein
MQVTARWHHVVATAICAVAFALVYQVTAVDSRYAARQAVLREASAVPSPGARLRFYATAYCKGEVTASGIWPRTGVVAADPALLPVGSVIQMADVPPYTGIYTVMDTGPMVQGRHIDLYMWSCFEALKFGRRAVEVTVLRLGWNPQTSTTGLLPSRPVPMTIARAPQ